MLNFILRTSAMVAVSLSVLAASPTISKSQKEADVVSQPSVESPKPTNTMVASIIAKADDRAARLEKYFQANTSPFSGSADDFVAIADKYELDWTLLPAIAKLESQLGQQVPAYSYNPYGWNNGRMRFRGWIEATETVASGLRSRYAPTGEVTAYRIGRMYAESPTWASRVTRYQTEIGAF